jgi:hypothetical protein
MSGVLHPPVSGLPLLFQDGRIGLRASARIGQIAFYAINQLEG